MPRETVGAKPRRGDAAERVAAIDNQHEHESGHDAVIAVVQNSSIITSIDDMAGLTFGTMPG